MTNENLLTRIATTVGSRQAENIASGALIYLLQKDPGVRRSFLASIEQLAEVTFAPSLVFRGQVALSGMGVSDISGIDEAAEVLIVEAKILAGLGPDQAKRYLRRLDGKGVLAVLAPESRLSVVFREACSQCETGADGLRADVNGTVLVGFSWEAALQSIQGSTLDPGIRAEIEQVAGLYRRLESDAFMPFSDDDLSARAARLWSSLDTIVTRVKSQAMTAYGTKGSVVFPPRYPLRGGERFYGVYCTISGFNTWFGRHTALWLELEETPYWLQINNLDQTQSDAIHDALTGERTAAESSFGPLRRAAATDIFVPLKPSIGVDADVVVQKLLTLILEVGDRLSAKGVEGPYLPAAGVAAAGGAEMITDPATAGEDCLGPDALGDTRRPALDAEPDI